MTLGKFSDKINISILLRIFSYGNSTDFICKMIHYSDTFQNIVASSVKEGLYSLPVNGCY